MANSIELEVITPEKLFYEGEVEIVIVRTLEGEEGFMANHSWSTKLLDIGEIWIKEAESKDFKLAAISGGFVDVQGDVMIFTDSAEWPEDIDPERTKLAKENAESWLKSEEASKATPEEILDREQALKRALNREKVLAGGSAPRRR